MGSNKTAKKTVKKEIGLGGNPDSDFVFEQKKINLEKVLDLTDPQERKKLGVTYKDLTEKKETNINAYKLTQEIGREAKKKGFEGIKAPSAVDEKGVNLVIFKK